MYDHQIAQLIGQARGVSGGTFEQRFDFRLRVFESFLEQEAAVEDGRAPVGDAGRLDAVNRLSSGNAVDVERGMAGEWRDDRNLRFTKREGRDQLTPDAFQDEPHVVDRVDAQEWHAAVADPSARGDFEPINAAVSDADAIHVQRLRAEHCVGKVWG